MARPIDIEPGTVKVSRSDNEIMAQLERGILVCLSSEDASFFGACSIDLAEGAKTNCTVIDLLKAFKENNAPRKGLTAKLVASCLKTPKTQEILSEIEATLGKFGIQVVSRSLNANPSRIRFFKNGGLRLQRVAADSFTSTAKGKTSDPVAPAKSSFNVMVVDDSKSVTALLRKALEDHPTLNVVCSASDPLEAEEQLKKHEVDLILLDLHMPKMSGLEYLNTHLRRRHVQVIVVTSLNPEDGDLVMRCLDAGAFDFISKPSGDNIPAFIKHLRAVSEAATSAIKPAMSIRATSRESKFDNLSNMVVIGSSTGGTTAIRVILEALPAEIPPILIAQHIPPRFSKLLADRLNSDCPFLIKEAENGDKIQPNQVLIAPGGMHMRLGNRGSIQLAPSAGESIHTPSVDVLFESVATHAKDPVIAMVLTGMGKDGAKGLLKLRNAGHYTIAQSEETCVVYGMPKEAVKLQAAAKVIDLDKIANHIAHVDIAQAVKSKIAG